MTQEQKLLAETITNCYNGAVRFNMVTAARIVGVYRGGVPRWLHERGVMVEDTGRDKYVHVNDLVVAMTTGRVSPL